MRVCRFLVICIIIIFNIVYRSMTVHIFIPILNSNPSIVLGYRYFTDVHGTIIMFDVSRKQTLVNALSDRGSNRGRKQKSWIKEVDFRAEDDNLPVKILG